MKVKFSALVLLITLISATSCTSFKPVTKSSDYSDVLKKGDVTRITLSEGSKPFQFKIEEVATDTLKGFVHVYSKNGSLVLKSKALPIEEIHSLKKRKFSIGKTIALSGGIVVVLYGVSWYSFEHTSFSFIF